MPSYKAYEPQNAVVKIPYWLERSDGSLPKTTLDSMKIMRQGTEVDSREMTITNIRNREHDFTLDQSGFQVWNLPEMPDYTKDDEEIMATEYPRLVEKIRQVTGGYHVRVFSHIVRDAIDHASAAEKLDPRAFGKDGPKSPAIRPHADFEIESCPDFFGDRPRLSQFMKTGRRWQIIGVWRPLRTVTRHPFAMLDARSVQASDYVKVPRDHNGRLGASSILKPGNGIEHKWYYLHEQRPDEAWLFKHFDSLKEDGLARQCAHTALALPGTWHLPPRESVEFRVFVGY